MDRLRRKRDTAATAAAGSSSSTGVASRTRAATRDQKIQKAKEAEKEGKENKKVIASSAAKPKSKESAASKISNEKENARIPAASSRRAAPSNIAASAATTATKAPHPSTHRLEEPVKVPPRPKREVATAAKAGKASPGSPRKRKKAEATSSTKGSAEEEDPKRARCRGRQEDVLAEKTPVPHLLQERLLSRPVPPAALLASPVAPGTPLYPRLDVETSTPPSSPAAAARSLSPRGQPGPAAASYGVIPFSVSTEEALATFTQWKSNLWFAPSDFNEATENPVVERVWVPYHAMTVAVEATLIATTTTTAPTVATTSTSTPTKTPPRAPRQQQVACELSGTERIFVCAAQFEDERRRLKHVEDEELLASEEEVISEARRRDEGGVVRLGLAKDGLMRLVDGELRQRLERKGKAEICQHHQVAGVAMKEADIKHTKMDKLRVRIEKDRAVLMPVYVISYHYGTTADEPSVGCSTSSHGTAGQGRARFVFLVNGTTRKCWGERPWGMGTLLSKGIGALTSILGTDDEDRIGLVEGALLRRVDCSPHYERDSLYLVFPPSHSYLITSAPGWIRLKNCSGDSDDGHHVELLSWRRKGERPLGRFTLAPGQEEVFDFRGRWCIEVRASAKLLSSAPVQVVSFETTGGGGYGNKLNMHHEGLW